MRNTIAKRLAAVITISALLVAVPGTAFAQTEPVESSVPEADRSLTIDQLKRRALEAIEKRLDAITRWTETVEANEHLDADHRARLLADLSATTRGLSSLADDIEAATTYSELGRLIPKIVEDYWVFALLGPKVHLVVAADVMADINDRFDEVAASIQEAIDRLTKAGYDPTAAQAALDRMQAHLVSASTLIEPVPVRFWPFGRPTCRRRAQTSGPLGPTSSRLLKSCGLLRRLLTRPSKQSGTPSIASPATRAMQGRRPAGSAGRRS